jgi:hypothetical protein
MKYSLLITTIILASLCIAFNSWAKKDEVISLVPTSKLKGNASFDSVVVMDLREQKGNIGNMLGTNVATRDSLSIALKNFTQQMIDSASQKQNNRLLILVKALEYKDRIRNILNGNLAVSTIHLRLDCYLGNNNGYRHVTGIDSLYEYPSLAREKDKLAALNGSLNYLLTMMISAVTIADSNGLSAQSIEQILAAERIVRNTISIYNSAPQKGVYFTSEQFFNNTPVDIGFIHERNCLEACFDRFYIPKDNEPKKKRKNLADTACFAIYDGEKKKWYRPYTATDFKEMKIENGDFYYLEIQKGLYVEDYSSLSSAGFQFGVLGALAYAGAAAILEDKQAKNQYKYKDALYKMYLNPLTGKGVKVERLQ